MKFILIILSLFQFVRASAQDKLQSLPVFNEMKSVGTEPDWLLDQGDFAAKIYRSENNKDLVISNGLVSRSFRLYPYFACYSFKNNMTGREMLRAIRPESEVEIDGKNYRIGGVTGQFEYAYLQYDWLKKFSNDPAAFQFSRFTIRNIRPRFAWKPVRWAPDKQWPPKGKEVIFYFQPPAGELPGISLEIHYEIYDHIPLMSKWIVVKNDARQDVRINTFVNEILSLVEEESVVGGDGRLSSPHINVQSDYSFGDMTSRYADHTTYWLPDSLYTSQVNYNLQTPCLLESRPPIGPWYRLPPHEQFEAFHTYELMYDSYDKERCGLEERKMYRILAPWVTENPIFLHLTTTDPVKVKAAIDQCAGVGFEMVILSFGSGLNMEDTSEANMARYKLLADYAKKKGVELGGYSLFSSRSIDAADDVINPKTGKPGGAIFGNAPCLGSRWGLDYIKKLKTFITKTGFHLLENDGPYPGDICASTSHPGHEGLLDSQWKQWREEVSFYRWLRGKDIYLNAPDWYFLNGSSKIGMGYRETDWSLPRDRQIIIERQNIYDGTWTKTPSMGWAFVPLTQYHGGGAAATIEPLHEHLEAYKTHLMQNFGSGVQACYRGPRLYDEPATEAMVKAAVSWYKKYRTILNSDIIHLRRAGGRDWDGIMHVNPSLKEKALIMLYNPLDTVINRMIRLPLYYTGLTKQAKIRESEGTYKIYSLDNHENAVLPVRIPARGSTWFVVE